MTPVFSRLQAASALLAALILGPGSLCCPAAWAEQPHDNTPPPQLTADVSEELALARKSATEGDRLGEQARKISRDNPEEQIKLSDQQLERYKEAQKAFRAALEKDPKNPHVLAEYARFWIGQRQFVHARAALEMALKSLNPPPRKPDDKTPPPVDYMLAFSAEEKAEFNAELQRTLGGVLERAGETDAAIVTYYKALDLVPTDPKTRISLTIALCAYGRPQETIKLLKGWNEEGQGVGVPKQPEIRALGVYTLAVALEETGFYEDALQSYTVARKLALDAGPKETTGVLDLASLSIERLQDFFDTLREKAAAREKENAERAKRHEAPLPDDRAEIARALADFDQGLSFKDRALKDESFVKVMARTRAGWGSGEPEDLISNHPSFDTWEEGLKWFSAALQIYPRLHQAAYQLALCNVVTGHYAPARTYLEAAIVASPFNLATLNEQGAVLLELGQWDEAAAVFKKILTLDPDSGSANFGLATSLAALQRDEGECRGALNAFDRSAQLGYRDPRMFHTQVLVKKDGTEFHGRIKLDASGENYIVKLYDKDQPVPKKECEELVEKPSLREEIQDMLDRFARGERPAPPPKLRKHAAKKRTPADPFKGTIFDNNR